MGAVVRRRKEPSLFPSQIDCFVSLRDDDNDDYHEDNSCFTM